MHQTYTKLFFYIFTMLSSTAFSTGLTSSEIILPVNTPLVLSNTNNISINQLCEMHVASSATQYLSIKVISGNGIFNGTTFKKGDSLISALYNMQQIPFTAAPGTKAEVTNLGPYIVKAVCA